MKGNVNKSIWLIILLQLSYGVFAQIKSPEEYFDNRYGNEFIYHHEVVEYFQYVAENSPYVTIEMYGKTNEHRTLMVAYVSKPSNLQNLENIRTAHLDDLKNGTNKNNTTLVWLSHSVHGNESAGTESAPMTLYNLITKHQDWLENGIVIIDPAVNPDGFSRYVNWKNESNSRVPNVNPDDREHDEPWPGGRFNHYYFDLNRDWAWQTQVESQQRAVLYHKWLPHVHVDLHEMGVNSPYYFAPAAAPYHDYITPWQREFQISIGKNNAKYFDKNGWLYFTKEVFDLFYPSYGDTYPTYMGSIGMTYEQGGSGRAGRSIKMENGENLTIGDRMDHHSTAALSTVEVSMQHGQELRENMSRFFSQKKPGKYSSYLIKADPSGYKIAELAQLLDRLQIEYSTLNASKSISGYSYTSGSSGKATAGPGDLVVTSNQFNGLLTQILLEPKHHLVDSNTYDITAWSLPYAYGLDAYGLTSSLDGSTDFESKKRTKDVKEGAYAYIIPWTGIPSARALSQLVKEKIQVRKINSSLQTSDDISVEAGSLLITKADNLSIQNLADKVRKSLIDADVDIFSSNSGFVEKGFDFGSGNYSLINDPSIALFYGDGVSPLSYGHLKHYLENEINASYTSIDIGNIGRMDLSTYHTILLPEGYYSLSSENVKSLSEWVRKGNNLIAIGSAVTKLADKEGFAVSMKNDDSKEENENEELKAKLENYHNHRRSRISNFSPGAIIRYELDNTHPLGYGLPSHYFSLKDNSIYFPHQTDAWNVARTSSNPLSEGFIGHNVKKEMGEKSLFLVEESGRGTVTYLSDPVVFRGFWKNGAHILSNAIFMVPR